MCSGRTPSMPPAQSRGRAPRVRSVPAITAPPRPASSAQQVHRRRADEARDERVRRLLVEVDRRAVLLDAARRRSSTTRSAIDIASTWSCVTYTIVMPSLRCSARISRRISARSCASRFDSGSSIRHTGASRDDRAARARRAAAGRRRAATACARAAASARAGRRRARGARRTRLPRTLRTAQAEHDVLGDASDAGTARSSGTPSRSLRCRRRQVRHVAAGDQDASAVGGFESGDEAQRRRLAAARRSEQHVERALVERERDAVDGAHVAFGGRPVLAQVFGERWPTSRIARDDRRLHGLARTARSSAARRDRARA